MSTLGEELISNERVALTELVKNAYDADASLVVIRFNGPLEEGAGSIEVWDDGHGMSPENVRSTWLEIATPHRHRAPRSEGLGRRVLGAKGIGRFSAARLAHTLMLTSRRRHEPEVTVRVDWGDFSDDDAYLDQVPVDYSTGDPAVFATDGEAWQLFDNVTRDLRTLGSGPFGDGDQEPHGTLVRLERLRQPWTAESVAALKRTLSRLLPPPPPAELSVPQQPEFSIYVDTPQGELRGLAGFVAPSEALAHPHYRLVGTVDADGQADLRLRASSTDEEIVVRERLVEPSFRPSCGPLALDIRAWDLDTESLRNLLEIDLGARNTSDLRRLIKDSMGIALYRDGFRVQPFGEPDFDWLTLDRRRINNPSLRLSNNQVAGFVYVTADGNPGLRDRSHREGLMDSPEYEELKSRLILAISRLETLRFRIRREARERADPRVGRLGLAPEGGGSRGVFDSFDLQPLQDVVARRYPDDVELGRAVEQASESVRTGVEKVQEILAQFSRLATLGSLVDAVLHDGRTALARISLDLWRLDRVVKRVGGPDPELARELERIHSNISAQETALDRLFGRIEPVGGRPRGRKKRSSLHEVVRQAASVHEAELRKHDITLTIGGDDVTVEVEQGDMNALILNLVGNAIHWITSLPDNGDRRILIETGRTPEGDIDIVVSDSGPGVREDIRDQIFQPYFSSKPDGVGLGLTIAGTVVRDFYDGDLSLMASGPLPGACFRARLRKGAVGDPTS